MKITDLTLDSGNANKGTDRGRKALAESLKTYGAGRSILVDKKGRVIAGNKTLEQAIAQGHKDVLVVKTDGSKLVAVQRMDLSLSDKRAKALAIADNRVGELDLEWDAAVLAELGKDIDLSAFWDAKELELLLGENGNTGEAPEPQLDRAAELQKKWKTKLGQLWLIGEHRLLCGDSTKKEDVGRVMAESEANCVLTDPPYGQDQPGVPGDNPDGLSALINGTVECLPCSNAAVVAFQSPRTFPVWLDAIRANGYHFERLLWLYKTAQCAHPWRGWLLKSEAILAASIGKPDWNEVNPYTHDCYTVSEVSGELSDNLGWHGSVKPLAIVRDILTRISKPTGIVYEPFLGSGTTMVAAQKENRRCYALEIEPKYVAVALERLSDMGLKPKLSSK